MIKRILLISTIMILFIPRIVPAYERAGNVVSVMGNAFVERQTLEIKAEKRFELLEEDNVRTEHDSRIKMLFRDDSILTLGPKSRLIIKQYLYSPESKRAESIYELIDGKLRAVVGNATFRITTPTAFSAARGTMYIVWYDAVKEMTGIAVLEGEVEAGNINPEIKGSVVVHRGEVVYIFKNMPPSLPVPFEKGDKSEAGSASIDTLMDDIPDIRLPGKKILTFKYPEWLHGAKPQIDQRPEVSTKIYMHLNFP